jgi:hypothetical protein
VQLTAGSTPTDDQWRAIFFLTANLICRSRWARDHNLWQLERAQKVLPAAIEAIKEMPPLPEVVRHLGLTADEMNELPRVLNRASKLLYPLTAGRGTVPVAELLKAAKDCDLLLAPAGSTFITSDEPALILEGGQVAMLTVGHHFLAEPILRSMCRSSPIMLASGPQGRLEPAGPSRRKKSPDSIK